MTYAFVQKKQNSISGGSSTTVASGNSDTAITAGNALFWIVAYNAASARTITMAGNSNTYTEVGNFRDTTTQIGLIWGYAENVNGGTTELTATFNASVSSRSICFAEYSGLRIDGTIYGANEDAEGNQATPGTGTDGVTTGNITPGQQPGVLVGFAFDVIAGNTPNSGTGFTDRGGVWVFGGANNFARLEDKRVTSTSAVAATFTATNNQRHLSAAIFLREVVAGGATVVVTDEVTAVDDLTRSRIRVRQATDDTVLLDSTLFNLLRTRQLTDDIALVVDQSLTSRLTVRRIDEELVVTDDTVKIQRLVRLLQEDLILVDDLVAFIAQPPGLQVDARPRISVERALVSLGVDDEINLGLEQFSISLGVDDA